MKVLSALAGAVLASAIFTCTANATTLGGTLTADDTFSAYISTNDSVLGTLILTDPDGSWLSNQSFSGVALTPGVTHYLHIVVKDLYGPPTALLGQFTLSDANYKFANGTQTLLTNTADWTVSQGVGPGFAWFAPSGTPVSQGTNGVGPWGLRGSIDASAQWIWYALSPSPGTAYFSAAITPSSVETPLPAALPLFATGLGVLALIARRRRKAAASA